MEQTSKKSTVPPHYENDLFRAMVEQAGDAIIFIDGTGSILVWNRGAELIFGHSAAEAIASGLDVIIPQRLQKAHWDGFNRAMQAGHTRNGDRVMTTKSIHKDGHTIYVDLHFCIITDAAGAALGALAIGRDCTERYLAEKARR